MTDQELKDLVASLAVAQAKTDAQIAKTNATLKSIGIQLGGISKNNGDVAEEFFYNTLRKKPVIAGIEFDSVNHNLLRSRGKLEKEFDIVLINGSSVALIEVKYKVHLNDVEQAEQQVGYYRELFPEHRDYRIYTGIAGMSVPASVADAARKRGQFVLKQVGKLIEVDAQAMRAF